MYIIGGIIKTMAGTDMEDGVIRIVNGKIAEIGTRDEVSVHPADHEQILEINKGIIMPGIIEAHCHMGITEEKKAMEGDDCNETVNPITPWLRAVDAINTMDAAFDDAVRAGITSAMVGPGSSNVVGGQFAFLKTKGRRIDDLIVRAPAAMKIAFGENPKVNYSGQGKSPSTRMAIAGMLRREIPLKAHVHRVDDIFTAVRIAREFGLNVTLDHCSEGHLIAEELAAEGFPAIVGPDLASRSKIEVQNMAFKTVGILNKAGVMTAVTTDHPVSLIQSLPLCAGMAVKAGLDLEEGYRSITIYPARICGVDDRVGSLEVGKDADIAIYTGNPMEVFTETLYTIIDGHIVYDSNSEAVQGFRS